MRWGRRDGGARIASPADSAAPAAVVPASARAAEAEAWRNEVLLLLDAADMREEASADKVLLLLHRLLNEVTAVAVAAEGEASVRAEPTGEER